MSGDDKCTELQIIAGSLGMPHANARVLLLHTAVRLRGARDPAQ